LQKGFLQHPNQNKKKKKLKITLAETHENLFTVAKIEIAEIEIARIEIAEIESHTLHALSQMRPTSYLRFRNTLAGRT
jgi:hypothetical protein